VQEDLLNEKIGNGFDSHRFMTGDGLMIGGYKVPCEHKFDAHSDGDIVLHALIDSMLGALGLGDIGTHFPKLNTFRKNIIASLKNITGLEESNIGFKAKTSEKMGFIGNNEGAACFVMAKLTK
jgi:2C-methyl-D-erythritol 2,4-cyclodiphosphate synthase